MTFIEWLERVDRALRNLVGMTHMDLPDAPYADWYDDKVPPVRAARRAIKNAESSF